MLFDRVLTNPPFAARRLFETAFRTWADKYAVTLRDLEAQREAAATRLETCLKELGYA